MITGMIITALIVTQLFSLLYIWMLRQDLEYTEGAAAEYFSKIQYLIDYMDLPEGVFAFPDGDIWGQTDNDAEN